MATLTNFATLIHPDIQLKDIVEEFYEFKYLNPKKQKRASYLASHSLFANNNCFLTTRISKVKNFSSRLDI